MSIHKLRRKLTAANKKLKWYEEHFEGFPSSRRRRFAYLRRMFERDQIRMNLAMERARIPKGWEAELFKRRDEGLRGFHIPFDFAHGHTTEK